MDSQDDSATEMSNVEDLINQKVDLILINPTDSDAVKSAVEAANAADIPVITLDRGANCGEGKVVELEGIPGASAARDRGEGFNKALEGTNIEVVARQTANFDRAEGLSVMENILQAQTEIDAVFAHNDEMALGALEAIKASGRDILVVGFDATADAKTAVEQLPKMIGSLGVENAMKVINGESVEKTIPVNLQLVTKK